MTDLHTHILPGMDDGAADVSESMALLRMERAQGVDTVVLTPHFYRQKETAEYFLRRRQRAAEALEQGLAALEENERQALPRLVLGAEVDMVPNMAQWEQLSALCIGQTKHLLLELPRSPWTGQTVNELYHLISRTGITPIIAHLERYLPYQRREMIEEILQLGVPVQITGDALVRWLERRRVLSLLQRHGDWLIASDCHRVVSRPPVMKPAIEILEKKLGIQRVHEMLSLADALGAAAK